MDWKKMAAEAMQQAGDVVEQAKAKGWTEVVMSAVDAARAPIADKLALLNEHVRVDAANHSIFLSDWALIRAVEFAAKNSEGIELDEFKRGEAGYDCTLRTSSGVVHVVVEPTSIEWKDDKIVVHLATHSAVLIEQRPVVTVIARAIASMFGGTQVAEKLLSAPLPSHVRWNGREVAAEFGLPSATVMLAGQTVLPVNRGKTHGKDGAWLQCRSAEDAERLRNDLLKYVGAFAMEFATKPKS